MTADRLYDLRYDQLYDRLLRVLSALPVIESRRDTVEDVAKYLCSIYWSPPDDFAPDITKQDERDLRALWKRGNALRLHINFKMSENARVAMKIDYGRHQLVRMEMTAERILERLGAHHPGRPRKRRARGSIDETVIGEGTSVRPGSWTGAKAQDGSPENLRGPTHVHARATHEAMGTFSMRQRKLPLGAFLGEATRAAILIVALHTSQEGAMR